MANERGVCAREWEVRALLAEAKTQWRFPVKFNASGMVTRNGHGAFVRDRIGMVWRPFGGSPEVPMPSEEVAKFCPYGIAGDRIWVKEKFTVYPTPGCSFGDAMMGRRLSIWYGGEGDATRRDIVGQAINGVGIHIDIPAAEFNEERYGLFNSPRFMPRWASRLTLEITGVSVERLHDITEADVTAEGITQADCERIGGVKYPVTSTFAYKQLWDASNGKKHPWESNPWCWVLDIKKLES